MIGEEVMEWLSAFWDTAGAGVVAGTMIVIWDVLRIWIQSKWLVRKLNQPADCPNHNEILKQLEEISKKIGANNEPGDTDSN